MAAELAAKSAALLNEAIGVVDQRRQGNILRLIRHTNAGGEAVFPRSLFFLGFPDLGRVRFVGHLAVNIGPELLHHNGDRV